jgi:alpha-L-fucosidase 2
MAGKLVTNPSHSPENKFRKADGIESMFTYGATMDLQITRELFTHCLEAIRVLGKDQPFDEAFKQELENALSRLAPVQVSPNTGRIQEWMEDYAEPEPGHRHISHLYGLYPASQITPRLTPELCLAARKSLEARLNGGGTGISSGGGTGWSRAWITLFYARLGDKEASYKHHQALLANFMLPNLFGDHPPFQIDANFGGAAGLAEMLLQSHENELSLLPALPPQWASGTVRGLRSRGGYTVDLQWRDGRLTQSDIHATRDGTCRVRAGGPVWIMLNGKAVESRAAAEGVVTFAAAAGKTYRLTAAP